MGRELGKEPKDDQNKKSIQGKTGSGRQFQTTRRGSEEVKVTDVGPESMGGRQNANFAANFGHGGYIGRGEIATVGKKGRVAVDRGGLLNKGRKEIQHKKSELEVWYGENGAGI